jgi:hypothetical protein
MRNAGERGIVRGRLDEPVDVGVACARERLVLGTKVTTKRPAAARRGFRLFRRHAPFPFLAFTTVLRGVSVRPHAV